MKVLHLVPSMNPATGGIYEGIKNLIPALDKLNICNQVACLDDPSEDFLHENSFKIIALGPGRGKWFYSKKLVPWLSENLSKFDAILVHGLWLFHGYAFLQALQKYRKKRTAAGQKPELPKFFIMPHGMLDPYFQRAHGRKLKAIRNWVYWKLIENKLINQADGIFFTTSKEMELARETFSPYRPKKERNVGFGIPCPPVFDKQMAIDFYAKCPQVGNKPYILFLSRIHQKKGVENLINAYEKIISKTVENSITKQEVFTLPQLVIAGPGLDSPYGKKIIQIINRSAFLKKFIHFPGMLSGNAKWGAFYQAGAFVLPSHQENFGVAVAEALACNKPVLISNQVNIHKEIESFKAGIVQNDTLPGTVQMLQKYFRLSADDRKGMGVNAGLAFKTHFTMASVAERMNNCFNEQC